MTICDTRSVSPAVAADRLSVGARSSQRKVSPEQVGVRESEEANQRVGPLVELPGLLQEFGTDPTELIASAGFYADVLSDLENRGPFVALGRLLHACAVKTGCEHFALMLGLRTRLSHLGLPGQLVRYSPTLGAAVRTFAVYQHLNNQGMATFLLTKDGVATLGSAVLQKGTEHVEQIYDFSSAAMLALMRELYGPFWRPERVLFSHSKPADAGAYRGVFQAPCRFNSESTALVFPASVLDHRLATADAEQLRILEAQASARDDLDLVFRLRRALRVLLLDQSVSGDQVARLLLMHRRTLNRRLKAEGTTFQKLLDEIRFEAACQLLDVAHIPITEIAASLGYAETSAFSRAFRRWSGATPVERRRGSQTRPSRPGVRSQPSARHAS